MRFFYFITTVFFLSISSAKTATFSEKHVDPFFQRAVDKTSLTLLATGIASFYLVSPQDDSIRSQWRGHQKISKRDSHTGDLLGTGGAGVLLVGAQYFFDDNQDHWVSHTRALLWGTVFIYGLKYPLNRQRPGNSKNWQSLPSGHTTTAFVTATSLTYTYGWKAAVIAYPIAAFVGLTRLSDDVHWGSDVVAGAFLGYIVGRAATYSTSDIEAESQTQSIVYPIINSDQLGLGLSYNF